MINVNLEDQPAPKLNVSLEPEGEITPVLPPDVIERRAVKALYAMGGSDRSLTEIRQSLLTPESERQLRKELAMEKVLEGQKVRQQMIMEVVNEAAEYGRPISPAEQEAIYGLSDREIVDSETVLEGMFAQRYVEGLVGVDTAINDDEADFSRSLEEDPAAAYTVLDVTELAVKKQESVHRINEDVFARYEDTGWARWGVDLGAQLLPGRSLWGPIAQADLPNPDNTWWFGEQREAQYRYLWSLPAHEIGREYKKVVDELMSKNVLDAMEFARGMVAYTKTDAFWDDTIGLVDFADATALTGMVTKGAFKGVAALVRGSKSAIRNNANPNATVSDALVVGGDIDGAARVKAGEILDISASGAPGNPARQMREIAALQPGLMNPNAWMQGPSGLSAPQTSRFFDTLSGVRDTLLDVLVKGRRGGRVQSDEALRMMFDQADKTFRRTYGYIEDSIIDVKPVHDSAKGFGGVDHIEILVGNKNAKPFRSETAAKTWATKYGGLNASQYDVVRYQDTQFYVVRMTQNMDETSLPVRMARVSTDDANPESLANLFGGILRSAAGVLSEKHMARRAQIAYGQSKIGVMMEKAAKPLISGMTRGERERVVSMLDDNRTMIEKVMDDNFNVVDYEGSWYYTVGDFQEAYTRKYQSAPSMGEIEAYFTYKMFHDWDYYAQNLRKYVDTGRRGVQEVSVGFPQAVPESGRAITEGGENLFLGTEGTLSVTIETPWFKGKVVDALPSWDKNFNIAWTPTKNTRQARVLNSTKTFGKDRAEIETAVREGDVKIVQVYNPDDPQVRGVFPSEGELVHYVLSPNVRTRPLNPVQVPYRGGPHTAYNENLFYVKQASSRKTGMGRRIVGRDRTWITATSEAKSKKFLQYMEGGRKLLLEGKALIAAKASKADLKVWKAKLNTYVEKNLPYESGSVFKRLFRDFQDEATEDAFDINVPFVVTRQGERALDKLGKDSFQSLYPGQEVVDMMSDPDALVTQIAGQSRHRDGHLWTISETGSEQNPIYRLRQVSSLDPMKTLQRSASQMARARDYDNYVYSAVEDWITQFGHLLDMPKGEVLSDPLWTIRNPRWKDLGRADPTVAAAADSRRAILNLMSQDTHYTGMMRATRDAILNSAYKRLGANAADNLEPWMWSEQSNPTGMARGWVFSAKMGFWNMRQLFMQGQGSLIVGMIDGNPLRAVQANLSANLMQAAYLGRNNSKFMEHLSKSAKAMGMTPDEFLEMYKIADETGIMELGGEYATYDRQVSRITRGVGTKFREAGHGPFRFGERHVRLTGFNTAYLRWRSENPTARVTDQVVQHLIDRTHKLSLDMTRAANNPNLQQGIPGLFTQFFTFHTRLTEAMIGGRMTNAERIRLAMLMPVTYGVPAGIAAAGLGVAVNVNELMTQKAIEWGYDPTDPWFKLFMGGAASFIGEYIAGQDTDAARSMGPSGLNWFSDLVWDGDVWTLGGAGTKFIRDMWDGVTPLTSALFYALDGNPDTDWALTPEDFIDPLREISSVNNAARAWYAWNTGMLLTKGGIQVTDVNRRAAALLAITGIVPADQQLAFDQKDILAARREGQRGLEEYAKRYGRRALLAAKERDWKTYDKQMRNMLAILDGSGYTPRERGQVVRRLISQTQPLIDQVEEQFTREMADPEIADQYLKRWKERFNRRKETQDGRIQ